MSFLHSFIEKLKCSNGLDSTDERMIKAYPKMMG